MDESIYSISYISGQSTGFTSDIANKFVRRFESEVITLDWNGEHDGK